MIAATALALWIAYSLGILYWCYRLLFDGINVRPRDALYAAAWPIYKVTGLRERVR